MKLAHPQVTALTIAGSDPSGGAGLQADLKTFQELGVYGMSVVTLLTVQNTQSVSRVELMPCDLVRQQLTAVLDDIPPRAIKLGALGNAELVRAVADGLVDVNCPIVIDPVMVSKHGHALAGEDVVEAYRVHLLPIASVITPNRFEAERLSGVCLDGTERAEDAAADRLLQAGAQSVLLKLGERDGLAQHLLATVSSRKRIGIPRLNSNHTHGSGCVLAAALAGYLAIGEVEVEQSVRLAIEFAWRAVNADSSLGFGIHPADVRASR